MPNSAAITCAAPSLLIKPESFAAFEQLKEEKDLDFIFADSVELIQESTNETKRINRIISTLKASSEMDFKQIDINKSLEDAVDHVSEKFSPTISIRKTFSPMLQCKCYELSLQQAFIQLLTNCFQAIDESGIIDVSTRSDDDWIIIVISDNGVGISETDIKRIFDPFFTTRNVGQGLGLGLSVAYETIHNGHHGDILVSSVLGQKTSFTIKLPLDA